MKNLLLLTAADAQQAGGLGGTVATTVFSIVLFIAFAYFLIIRPQQKEQKKASEMLSNLEVGDVVLTTSDFYGVIIDITDEDVIVEFGTNKNCRIPMRKSAIKQVEKAE